MKIFQRGCCLASLETNLKSLTLTKKFKKKIICGHLAEAQLCLLQTAAVSLFLQQSKHDNCLTSRKSAEPMVAGASDTPQVGIDTFHFQTLTNRISCGSLCHLKMFALLHESIATGHWLTWAGWTLMHLYVWWYKRQLDVAKQKDSAIGGL